jgi:hypothetical protein
MVLMPAPPPKDLAGYLHCLDNGVSYKYKEDPSYGGPIYNWSVRSLFFTVQRGRARDLFCSTSY